MTPTPNSTNSIKVLVVDDDIAICLLLEATLPLFGPIEIVGTAHDGFEGVEMAARLQPDVILLDLRMPVLDGVSAAPHLVAAAPHSKIVVFSAYINLVLRNSRPEWAAALLTKNSSPDEIARLLLTLTPQAAAAAPTDARDAST